MKIATKVILIVLIIIGLWLGYYVVKEYRVITNQLSNTNLLVSKQAVAIDETNNIIRAMSRCKIRILDRCYEVEEVEQFNCESDICIIQFRVKKDKE